jgi:hypothetical protein
VAPPSSRDPIAFIRSAWAGAVIALVGAPQTGKSRLAKDADAAGVWPRRLVYEPHGRRDRLEVARGRKLWPWRGRLVSVADVLRNPAILDVDPLALVAVPDGARDEAARGKLFSAIGELVWETGGITLIAEEAAIYARHALEVANLLATGGAHADVRLVLISQSWTRIPLDVRRCVSHVVAFTQSEPADVDELRKKCGKEFARRVAALNRGASPLLWALGDAR